MDKLRARARGRSVTLERGGPAGDVPRGVGGGDAGADGNLMGWGRVGRKGGWSIRERILAPREFLEQFHLTSIEVGVVPETPFGGEVLR